MAKYVYTGIGGVARNTKNIYIGVDGKARKVTKGYIGVGGVARLFFKSGITVSNLNVGASIYLNEDGYPIEYIIVHKGIPSYTKNPYVKYGNDDVYANDIRSLYVNCDGVWLLRKEVYPTITAQGKYSSYSGCGAIQELNNNTVYNLYDESVKSIIHNVSLPYYSMTDENSEGTGLSSHGVSSSNFGKVFPLSAKEIGMYRYYGRISSDIRINSCELEGFKLDYFKFNETEDSGSTDTEIDNEAYSLRATNNNWWTRSGNSYSSEYMSRGLQVTTSGCISSIVTTNTKKRYSRPALIIDYDSIVDENMVLIGK